ncbi:hypothetical protein D9M72_635460 [compost metagenome]
MLQPQQCERSGAHRVGVGADQGEGLTKRGNKGLEASVGERFGTGDQGAVRAERFTFPYGNGGDGGKLGEVR